MRNLSYAGAYFASLLITACLFGSILFSCQKENRWDMLKRCGERITENRQMPPFTKLFLQNNVNVFIRQGAVQQVAVEAGKNLAPLIRTEVINGELHIKDDNKCNWARSYKKGEVNVYLTVSSLKTIWHFGSGNIESQDTLTGDTIVVQTHESGDVKLILKAKIIYAQLGGSSDVTLSGRSPLMGVYHIGEGYLHAENLNTDITWSDSKASGNEYINAGQALSAKISWAGNIYYRGHPASVDARITGNGKLIPTN